MLHNMHQCQLFASPLPLAAMKLREAHTPHIRHRYGHVMDYELPCTAMDKVTGQPSVTVPGKLESLQIIGDFIRDHCVALQNFPDVLNDIQLAVDEACANIVKHGYSGSPGNITISLELQPDSVLIRISDTAPPFNGNSAPKPLLSGDVDRRQPGGLGIFLMKSLMTQVQYQRVGNKNILTMKKSWKEQTNEDNFL